MRTPEQIRIAITLENNSLVIMSFVTKEYESDYSEGWEKEPTKENIELEIKKSQVAWSSPMKSWRIIKDEEIPQDRTYRNAWEDKKDKIGHNMDKAKEQHRDFLRRQREPLMEKLDIEYLRADEAGNQQKKKDIIKEKQRLRDITALPEIDNAQTIEELKKITL